MAGTKFAYVRNFELPDATIPDTFLVVRIDGKGFHKFSAAHEFIKPNDPVALELMNESARYVLQSLKGQIALAFGESDEYSFLLRKTCTLYSRRVSKITTHIVSLFTSAYVFNWSRFFPEKPMNYPPSFDGRLVVYPNEKVVRDYFSWRQADTHINNLYNTTFWALVLQGGMTEQDATKRLEGTVSADKHEILFSNFGTNYDQLEAMYRKGTTLVWTTAEGASASASTSAPTLPQDDADADESAGFSETESSDQVLSNKKDERLRLKLERKRAAKEAKRQEKKDKKAQLSTLRTLHCDIIGDEFWLGEPDASASQRRNEPEADHQREPWKDPRRLECSGLGASVFMA